jgi:hypothetical protein
MMDYLEELPNLKDLLKQREQIFSSELDVIEAKRAKVESFDSAKTVIKNE